MATSKIFRTEALGDDERPGDRVAQGHCDRGRCCRCQIERTGFTVDGGHQSYVGHPRERTTRLSGHGDDWNAHRLESRDTGHQFTGLAGKRDAHEDVAGPDHAEIAVGGLVRVHEKRSRARGRERGGKFASDVPRLANPGENDVALGLQDQAHCRDKRGSQIVFHLFQCLTFQIEHPTAFGQNLSISHRHEYLLLACIG